MAVGFDVSLASVAGELNSRDLLESEDIWIADTGATTHVTKHARGGKNHRKTDVTTRGARGEAAEASYEMDIPVYHCSASGKECFPVQLMDVQVNEHFNFNLFSVTRVMKEGWELGGNEKELTLKKGNWVLKFDTVMHTRHGALFCGIFKRRMLQEEEMVNPFVPVGRERGGGEKDVEATKSVLKMSIQRAHDCLGHLSERTTRQTASSLGIGISRGALPICGSCAISKAKQKNVSKETEGSKACVFNGRNFHDLAKIRVPDEIEGVILQKSNWHILVDEASGFKRSAFHETKGGIVQDMCEYMHSEMARGQPVQILRQDNAKENLALLKMAKSATWKLTFKEELTARNTPQQNSKAETAFTVVAAQARSMMNAAQLSDKDRFKLWPEAVKTATFLNNLVPVTINGETKTRWEHAGHGLPSWTKNLRTFGEAGAVKEGKQGKVLDRGETMMFVGYNQNHGQNSFRMYNPKSSRVVITRDIIWLGRMFFPRRETKVTMQLPIVSVPISSVQAENETIELTIQTPEEREGTHMDSSLDSLLDSSSEKAHDGWTIHRTRSGREVGRKDGKYDPSTGKTIMWSDIVAATEELSSNQANYYDLLGIDEKELELFKSHNDALTEYVNVGAGIGGGFTNTQELKVMKYHEAINGPDGEAWKEEVRKEHGRMVHNQVFEPVALSDLPKNEKVIDTTWAMKKKSSGTLRGRVNVRGFKQIDGQHYDGTSISAPVTNAMTIKIVLTLMLMFRGIAHVVDVKGAFLYGDFEDGEKVYIKVPLGFEEFYNSGTVLLLKKTLYGLKQAAMAFYRKLLAATANIGLKRSTADPCLYYKWVDGRLVIMISWIDDNMIIGPTELVMQVKNDLMTQFECDDCGRLEEYVGNKIDYIGDDAIRFTQNVLMQSYSDEFELPRKGYNTPAQPGTVLMKPVENGVVLSGEAQSTLRSGIGKLMYHMQYSRPDIAQAVRDLARHMTRGDESHLEAMKRCMRYLTGTKDAGLTLQPTRKWDGAKDFLFRVRGVSDSDYAKDTQTRRSISGYVVYLEDAPVMHRSATQKTVALSVCEAEMNSAVLCAQDMIYAKHVLESLGLQVETPMMLQMDNKGAVDLINSFSVGGRTRHVDVRQCFLRELKEAKVMAVTWIPGTENEADMFTKNLDGPAFRRYAELLLGKGALGKDSE